MNNHPPAPAPTSVIWALGLTQIIGYGTLYYSFSVLASAMAIDLGWPEQWVYGVLSGSLLVGGLVAPIAGAWADRFGAARILAPGSIAAAAALALCALAPGRFGFIVGLVAIEVASAFVLYATAFAAIAQIAGPAAQRGITYLTLIAGFASTIFWPLTSLLHEHLSWQQVYLVFAAANLLICLPIHLWLARHSRRQTPVVDGPASSELPLVPEGQQPQAQAIMLLGFALLGFVSSATLVHMIPTLAALGLGSAGVFVTTLFGPAQVLSRLINMQFGRSLSQPRLAVVAAGLMPLALFALVGMAPSLAGAAAFALLFGLGSGLSSIVSGTLPLALFGRAGYGRRLGSISSARLIVSSFAPFAFALAAAALSTVATLWLLACIGLLCTASFGVIALRYGSPHPD